MCCACYSYFIDLNEVQIKKNNGKIIEFRDNSKELNVLFQEVFKTKTLDSDMREMLEQFVQGYQRIKKLSKLICDNVSYSDFNIIPSFNILTERINGNYEKLVNLKNMEFRLIEQESTVIENIEEVNRMRFETLQTLYSKILPGYKDCEILVESKFFKENIQDSEVINEKITELKSKKEIYIEKIKNQDELVDFTKDEIEKLTKDEKFFSSDYMIVNEPLIEKYKKSIGKCKKQITDSQKEILSIKEKIKYNDFLEKIENVD